MVANSTIPSVVRIMCCNTSNQLPTDTHSIVLCHIEPVHGLVEHRWVVITIQYMYHNIRLQMNVKVFYFLLFHLSRVLEPYDEEATNLCCMDAICYLHSQFISACDWNIQAANQFDLSTDATDTECTCN